VTNIISYLDSGCNKTCSGWESPEEREQDAWREEYDNAWFYGRGKHPEERHYGVDLKKMVEAASEERCVEVDEEVNREREEGMGRRVFSLRRVEGWFGE
jgi:hypothetical protein